MTRKIDLNHASSEELEEIDGIDSEHANALVERRAELGGFRDWADVDSTPGIDEAMMARLRASAALGEEEQESPKQRAVHARHAVGDSPGRELRRRFSPEEPDQPRRAPRRRGAPRKM